MPELTPGWFRDHLHSALLLLFLLSLATLAFEHLPGWPAGSAVRTRAAERVHVSEHGLSEHGEFPPVPGAADPGPAAWFVLAATETRVEAPAALPEAEAVAAPPAPRAHALPATRVAPPPPPAPPVPAGWTGATYAARILQLVNEQRVAAGLAPLVGENHLAMAAASYAAQMSEHDWFSHNGPDGRSFVDRIVAAGFPFDGALGEVLAKGSPDWSPEAMVSAWMDSPGHRAQILTTGYTVAGAGCFVSTDLRCVIDFGS